MQTLPGRPPSTPGMPSGITFTKQTWGRAYVMAIAGFLKAHRNVSFLGQRDLPHHRKERRALFHAATASTSQMFDERHFLRIIRTSVFAENVMKPDRRLTPVSVFRWIARV